MKHRSGLFMLCYKCTDFVKRINYSWDDRDTYMYVDAGHWVAII